MSDGDCNIHPKSGGIKCSSDIGKERSITVAAGWWLCHFIGVTDTGLN